MPTTDTQCNLSQVPLGKDSGPDTLQTILTIQVEPGLPTIPGYELVSELGRGGMGVVYKALDLKLKRHVAIKMLLDPEFASPEQRMRFKIEAEAVAQLQHPNIVQVYELGEMPGSKSGIPHPYMVLEYIDGLTLFRYMRQHPFNERDVATLLVTLARAMQHAHDHGLIHRDLKPANILIPSSESLVLSPESSPSSLSIQDSALRPVHPKITDFGLVKAVAHEGEGKRDLTRTQLMLGTPQYMAPEQANPAHQALSSSVDIYSLGVIFYELLTGQLPYDDGDILQMLMEVQTKEPASPRSIKPRVSIDLETICMKCLDKNPKQRYASAAALADDLTRFLNNEPILARPLSEWQRVAKWVQRHPTIATLVGMLFMVITVALIVIAGFWRQADSDRQLAVEQFHSAETARDAARSAETQSHQAEQVARQSEAQAQLALYFSKIAQSDLLLRQGRLDRPIMLLNECAKSPTLAVARGWEWYHLQRICRPMEHHMISSHDYVQRVVFHPTREMLFSIEGAEYYGELPPEAYPGRLLVHEPDGVSDKWRTRTLRTWKSPLRDLQLALAGSRAIVSDARENIYAVDMNSLLDDKELSKSILLASKHNWKLACDAGLVLLWDKEKPTSDLKLYDLKQGKIIRTIHLPGEVHDLAFSDNGEACIFILKNYTIGVWDIKDDSMRWQQHLAQKEYHVAISGNAKQVAYCNNSVGDLVWMETLTGKIIHKLPQIIGGAIQLSKEGDRLAVNSVNSASHDYLIWRRRPDGQVDSVPLVMRGHQGFMTGSCFDLSGNRFLTYGIDGTIRLWDTSFSESKGGSCLQVFRSHLGSVLHAAFDPQGDRIASGGIDANVLVWNTTHNVVTDLYPIGENFSGEWISAYAFIAGTQTLAVYEHRNSQILLLDLASRKIKQKFTLPEVFAGFRVPRNDCSFSGDGKLFAAVDKAQQRTLLYETQTGKLLWTSPGTDLRILHVYLSGNGKRLLFAGHIPMPGEERRATPFKCGYQVWDVEKKELVLRDELPRFCQSWTINQDGSRVAAALIQPGTKYELAVMLVNEKGKQLFAVPFQLNRCLSLAFSPDGQYLAGCNFDPQKNWLSIRDAQTGKELHKVQSVNESTHVTFTPDSRRVLVTGYDSHAIMFDPQSGHEVLALKHHGTPRQNDYALSPKLIFSQDGTKLAVHSWDAAITIWHAYSPSEIDSLKILTKIGEK